MLIVFNGMIVDMPSDKKLNPVITELFIKGGKLNISVAFITHSFPNSIRLNFTDCFVIKILNKRELQQITCNHLSDIDCKDFLNL